MRCRSDQFELGDGRFANAFDFAQARFGGMDGFRERAESPDQGLGQRLHVATGNNAEQHHFEQLIVAERARARARLAKALAQPFPMAVVMRRLLARGLRIDWIAGVAAHRLQCAVVAKFCNREVRAMAMSIA
jgi:hypothetical protein